MNSIFDIERRCDLESAFAAFIADMRMVRVATLANKHYTVYTYLERCIKYWPYRCGASGIDDYLNSIGIDINTPKNEKEYLLILELLINLLYWAPEQNDLDDTRADVIFGDRDEIKNETERLIENAEYILEQSCNMRIREERNKKFSKYYITRRNITVDLAVSAVPELSNVLLGYYDLRNEDNLDSKIAALTAIYGYLEPHRAEYRSLACSAVCEEFFASMNAFGIRHNNDMQKKMSIKRKKDLCNKLFMMAVYVLQTMDVNKYKLELKELREA